MANKFRVVIDTNVLLVSISGKSKYHWLFQAIINQKLDVFITNEILNEYEEKIDQHWSTLVAKSVVRTLTELPNVYLTATYFKLQLISVDEDDNKFVDCAFANNADYIVSNDRHFDILKEIPFPRINVVRLDEFEHIFKRLAHE